MNERDPRDEAARREPAAGPSGADLAREALEQAKADARRRGVAPGQRRTRESGGLDRPRRDGFSGRDPLALSGAIEELVADRGWELQASVATVFARWPDIVGAEVAAHTHPEGFDEGELVVVADSAAWATQVRLLSSRLLRRLRDELGDTSVLRVRVHGPSRRPPSGGGKGISSVRGP